MRRFAELYARLDASNRTNDKVTALVDYFRAAPPEDAAWAVALLTGDRPKRVVQARDLAWAVLESAKMPGWVLDECHDVVGDFAESLALLLPDGPASAPPLGLAAMMEERVLPLRSLTPGEAAGELRALWETLATADERLVFFKIITGAFRVGASKGLVLRALAEVAACEPAAMAARLSGTFRPSAAAFTALVDPASATDDPSRPYPFFLATPIDGAPAALGARAEFLVEWKWDGIRAELVRRAGVTWLWSRGEELIGPSFPEIAAAGDRLPDGTVLDGEVLAWAKDAVMPFAHLQRRVNAKGPTRKLLATVPVVLLAFDLLEEAGEDLRARPIEERRARLEALVGRVGHASLRVSPLVEGATWEEAEALWRTSRERGVEGMMLKRAGSPYRAGRPRGDWWKWKVDPLSVDCVLLYAQRGTGRRASLYSDYTFAVRDGDALVPFAKAYSGVTDAEVAELDAFVRAHTVARHGPLREVTPSVVVELGFEGVQRSPRHKSGLAVRFPRILRLRRDKAPADADTLATLHALADRYAAAPPDEGPKMTQLSLFSPGDKDKDT